MVSRAWGRGREMRKYDLMGTEFPFKIISGV